MTLTVFFFFSTMDFFYLMHFLGIVLYSTIQHRAEIIKVCSPLDVSALRSLLFKNSISILLCAVGNEPILISI